MTVLAWIVSLTDGRFTQRLHTYRRAYRLAERYNRRFGKRSAYVEHFGLVTLKPGQRLIGGQPRPV